VKHISDVLPGALAHLMLGDDKRGCFGISCTCHANCARWHAIEGNTTDQKRIAMCGADRPLYIPINAITQAVGPGEVLPQAV
jgi:hypothetical protein